MTVTVVGEATTCAGLSAVAVAVDDGDGSTEIVEASDDIDTGEPADSAPALGDDTAMESLGIGEG